MAKSPKAKSPPSSLDVVMNNSSKTVSEVSIVCGEFECDHVYDCETWKQPEFIFGGPFITVHRKEPGIFLSTPYNTELSGFYRGTKADQSLKKDIPKLIEAVRRDITGDNTSHEYTDYSSFMEEISYNLCTNKEFTKFDDSYIDSKMWNDALDETENKLPLMSRFGFSEAYAHTKMNEALDFLPNMKDYDYHASAKRQMIECQSGEEAMYMAASRFLEKLPPGDAETAEGQEPLAGEGDKKSKEEFISIIQFCLWANKNNKVIMGGQPDAKDLDPFQYIDHYKTNILADESGKIYDGINNRVKVMKKTLETAAAANPAKMTCSCHRLAKAAGIPICEHKEAKVKEETKTKENKTEENKGEENKEVENKEEGNEEEKQQAIAMKICPTKVTAPRSLTFDIICEQAGLELFSVMCLAHFLIARNMVEKVRFHVKKIPWYETHATANDIINLIEFCKNSTFTKIVPPLPPPIPVATKKKGKGKGKKAAPPPPPPPPDPETVEPTSSEPPQRLLQILGQKWSEFLSEGKFIIADDTFWVSPYTYKQMKSKAPWLYRSLQLNGIGAMFIGDLNYRRLLNEMRVLEGVPFETALQGFNPAPIIAVRNINCEVLCGLAGGGKKKKKKKKKQAASVVVNPAWFDTDDYGVIQYYGKVDTSKHVEKPCIHYGVECRGGVAQLVQVGIKAAAGGAAAGTEGEEGGGEAMLNVCTFPDKDNLCD